MKYLFTLPLFGFLFCAQTAFAQETILASYLVDLDGGLYDGLYVEEVTVDDQALVDDVDTHEWMWETFVNLNDRAFVAEHVSTFEVFVDDSSDSYVGFVVQDGGGGETWTVSLNIESALQDTEYFYETVVHEFSHILTLETDQVELSNAYVLPYYEESEFDERLQETIDTCETYFTGEGCAYEDSYIYQFVEAFWQDIFAEYGAIDTNGEEIDFYTGNEDNFVTWYAATNPGEDIAESYAMFVMEDQHDDGWVKDDKRNFFYAYDELVELRTAARAYLGLEESSESEENGGDEEDVPSLFSDDAITSTDGAPLIVVDETFIWYDDSIVESSVTASLIDRVAGKIMLMVDRYGEAWYVDPITRARYYLADGPTAYTFLRAFGLGITNADLDQIPTEDDDLGGGALAESLSGRILLQVEEHGEAWYVNPTDLKRYYLEDGDAAYTIMRELSEGTMAAWIEEINEGWIF